MWQYGLQVLFVEIQISSNGGWVCWHHYNAITDETVGSWVLDQQVSNNTKQNLKQTGQS